MLNWSGLKKRLPSSTHERRALAEPAHPRIPLTRQTELLGINRSTLYYRPTINQARLDLDKLHLNAIDEIYTRCPFYGSRRVKVALHHAYGIDIGRERVQHLMQQLGIQAVYPKPKLSQAAPGHPTYPYLLNGVTAQHPNHIWGSDITYIRTARGYVYLVAFLDWFSRYVVSWRLSVTMELDFCLEALDEALQQATPLISNTDQGSQFTAPAFTDKLTAREVKISMDGRGRCMDNIFTERLWRTIKYENVFLQSYGDYTEAHIGLAEYLRFYNNERRHQALGYRTPQEVYFNPQ